MTTSNLPLSSPTPNGMSSPASFGASRRSPHTRSPAMVTELMTNPHVVRSASPPRRTVKPPPSPCSSPARPLAGVKRWHLIPARANGQLALGAYVWDEEARAFMPHGVNVLALRGAQNEEITAFLTPDAVRGFGLPEAIQPSSQPEEKP